MRSNRRWRSKASRSRTKACSSSPVRPDWPLRSARRRQRSGVSSEGIAMGTQVIVNEVVNRVRAVDGAAAIAPETVAALAEVLLPMVRAMLQHDAQVCRERSLNNGYFDRIERGTK